MKIITFIHLRVPIFIRIPIILHSFFSTDFQISLFFLLQISPILFSLFTNYFTLSIFLQLVDSYGGQGMAVKERRGSWRAGKVVREGDGCEG